MLYETTNIDTTHNNSQYGKTNKENTISVLYKTSNIDTTHNTPTYYMEQTIQTLHTNL